MPFKYDSPFARLEANTVVSEENAYDGVACWDWIGARTCSTKRNTRYGKVTRRITRGPRKGAVQTMLAHRWVVQFVVGRRLSRSQVVMHLCNNPLCCNPAHLKGGTQRQNMRDMVAAGRHRNGSTR